MPTAWPWAASTASCTCCACCSPKPTSSWPSTVTRRSKISPRTHCGASSETPRRFCERGGVPVKGEVILEEFDDYLELQCGRSAHTRRAYLGDLRSLFDFLADRGSSLETLSLPVLRSWLATAAGAGAARTTLARRTSSVKAFTAWAVRRGVLSSDPAARLQVPKAHRTLPAVLRQDQALAAMTAAKSGAQQGDPLALRDRLI